jgi:transposase
VKVLNNSYLGKSVFVGIDVHKEKYVVASICDGQIVKRWTTVSDPQTLACQLNKYFQGARVVSAYEAGFSGFSLHRVLCSNGIDNKVIHAAGIPIEANNKVKTDRRDAKKIAEELAIGRLRCIYIPTQAEEQNRSLSRGREQAVNRRKVISNQLRMKLYYLGQPIPNNKKITERVLKWIDSLDFASEHKFVLNEMVMAWREETKRIQRFNEALIIQSEKDELEPIYRSTPGIGEISARVLSNELGDMSRFKNERQLFCWTGLTPSEYSSGENVRKGHISRQGSARMRGLLVEAAWNAIKKDPGLKTYYYRIASRRGGKRAIVAVARKLIGRIRYCLNNRVQWRQLDLAA